jgi:hypothetical protein
MLQRRPALSAAQAGRVAPENVARRFGAQVDDHRHEGDRAIVAALRVDAVDPEPRDVLAQPAKRRAGRGWRTGAIVIADGALDTRASGLGNSLTLASASLRSMVTEPEVGMPTADSGADRETAFNVALAKLRASHPVATEWELRTILAKALAATRQPLH